MKTVTAQVLCMMALSGCGGVTTDGDAGTGTGSDAGVSSDAGVPVNDAGAPFDAGVLPRDGGSGFKTCLQLDGGAMARLSVQGAQILDQHGVPIVLRGWNWGVWGTGSNQDAVDNAAQGATVVRLPVRWWGGYPVDVESYDPTASPWLKEEQLCELDQNISWAVNNHLWVILFVDSNCGQGSLTRDTVADCGSVNGTDAGPAKNFHNDPLMKQRFTDVWAHLVRRYVNVPYMGMYEILPEPNFTCGLHDSCPDWHIFPEFYASILPTIRKVEPTIPVIVGAGAGYNVAHIADAFIDGGTSIVYTGDLFLQPFTDADSYTVATQFRDRANVPIFIQQVGVRKSVPDAGAIVDEGLTKLNSLNLGWTWWTYREANSPDGLGYAPYSKGADWKLDQAWLNHITSHF